MIKLKTLKGEQLERELLEEKMKLFNNQNLLQKYTATLEDLKKMANIEKNLIADNIELDENSEQMYILFKIFLFLE